ncbi:MAG: hypothetical protein WBA88_03015 [Pseudaminobacter sp.]
MLARRFTIVCLLMALFGMAFSALVAKASRPAHSWEHGIARTCPGETSVRCVLTRPL